MGRSTLGTIGATALSLVVSMSAMGSLNANVFATARLCVAASQRKYFPAILANLHLERGTNESSYYEKLFKGQPRLVRDPLRKLATMTEHLRLEQEVPMYAGL